MTYLYSALGGIALLIATFFYGEHVQATADRAKAAEAQIQADKVVAQQNTVTQTHTLAAATHVQAIQARSAELHDRIKTAVLAPSTGGGSVNATFAPSTALACPDFLASSQFRLLYNAGSANTTGETDNLLPQSPPNP